MITCSTDGGGLLMVHGLQGWLPENDCKLDNVHLVIKNKDVRHLRFTSKYRGSQIRLITEGELFYPKWLLYQRQKSRFQPISLLEARIKKRVEPRDIQAIPGKTVYVRTTVRFVGKNKPFSLVLKTQSDSRLLVSNCLSLFKIEPITVRPSHFTFIMNI